MQDNQALLLDYYELTMANAYFQQGRAQEWAVFDYYFRRVPDHGGFAIFAGLETVLNYVRDLHFTPQQIDFLRRKGDLDQGFLAYLQNFRFAGEIYALAEGSVVFPNEPLLTVRAPLIDCQILETFLLLTLNHQSLIATKAARICAQAQGRKVFEFGSRRAHGGDAALYGSRAAYIGGTSGTANTQAEAVFGVPALGTMAHSFVQSFDDEYAAFAAYAQTYPENTVLLVDTYDVLRSGVPNAIRVHQEILQPQGKRLRGIRIDSGDLTYLSRRAREMLDSAGLPDCQIMLSNSLDEFLIKDLLLQEAAVDGFGVGERLITASSEPVFGGVYKIVALEQGGAVIPKIKISENLNKTTTPAFKQVWRLYNQENMAIADVVSLRDEMIDERQPYTLFDPQATWKRKIVQDFTAKPLLQLVWQDGKQTQPSPSLEQIRAHVQAELASLWSEVKRLENPHRYYVDLSQPLWALKQNMLSEIAQTMEKI